MARDLPGRKRSTPRRPQRNVIVVSIITIIILGTFVYLLYVDSNPPAHLVLNWTFHLAILDAATGKNITIPANIGVSGGIWLNHTLDSYGPPGYAPLSTRDTSGTIHVQSVAPRLFVLGEFFSIWGQVYNRTCVGYGLATYCSSAAPPVLSNGNTEYCVAYNIPPTERDKTWIIIINTTLGKANGC